MAQGVASGGIGRSVVRLEDERLVTGRGSYTDDMAPPGLCHTVLVRSPHAHARILRIDTAAAAVMPGVLAVLTGRDLLADGLRPLPHAAWSAHPVDIKLPNRD